MSKSQATATNTNTNGESKNAGNACPVDFNAWQHMTRTIAHYERLEQIGEGTYGQVYRARALDDGKIVALKKTRIHHGGYWGMPLQLIREIKILKRLQHPNLLKLIEVVTSKGVEHLDNDDPPAKNHQVKDKVADARESYKGNLFLVLEYVEHDLAALIDVAYQFTPVQIKCIFKQLLEALAFMHQNKYVHRDIKSSNLLLTSNFTLKLADFGLARSTEAPLFDQVQERKANLASGPELTNKVITLWYRPPEILLGAVQYGTAVDVWSAGCILAELMLGKPLFAAKTELDQLTMILEMLGPPKSQDTYEFFEKEMKKDTSKVPLSLSKSDRPPSKLASKYSQKIPPAAMSLLEKTLEWDPRKRATASSALTARYFLSEPAAPANPAELGETLNVGGPNGHFHEFLTKKQRRQAKVIADEAKEKARVEGKTEEEAQAVHEKVYRNLMKKVIEEGLGANDVYAASQEDVDPTTSSTKGDRGDKRRRSSERSNSPRVGEDESRSRRDGRRSRDRHDDESRRRSSRESRSRRDAESGRKRRRDDMDDSRGSRISRERRSREEYAEGRRREDPRDADMGDDSQGNEDADRHRDARTVRDRAVSQDDRHGRDMPREKVPSAADTGDIAARPERDNRRDRDQDRGRGPGFSRDRPARDRPSFPEPDRERGPYGDAERHRDRPPYEDSDYRRERPRYDDRDRFREFNDRERPGPPGDERGRDIDRPPMDDRGAPEGRPRDRPPDRLHFDGRGPPDDRGRDRPADRPPFDDRGLPDGRGRDRPLDRPPFDDRGRLDGRGRERPGDRLPLNDRGARDRDRPHGRHPFDDRGPPEGRGRERPMDRPPFDDRGPPDGRGRGRERPLDFDDRGPPDGRGRNRPPFDDRRLPDGRGRERPMERPPLDDRGIPGDGPPFDDRDRSGGRPPQKGRERPRDVPPFEREGPRDRPPRGHGRERDPPGGDFYREDRDWRRMGQPQDDRRREKGPPGGTDRPGDFPPLADDRDLPHDRPPSQVDDFDRARGPPPIEDRGRYGPSNIAEEDQQRREQASRPNGDPANPSNEAARLGETEGRPDRNDSGGRREKSGRRGDSHRRRKKDRKRRDRSRSRDRNEESRRKDRHRDERRRNEGNPDYYGPTHGQEGERRREDRDRHDDNREQGGRQHRDRHRGRH